MKKLGLLFLLCSFAAGCSSQSITEMRYILEIGAIDPDDVQYLAETAEVLENRISKISRNKKFSIERKGNTTYQAVFQTSMVPEAVEMVLTATGEVGFYEVCVADRLSDITYSIVKAAETDTVKYAGADKSFRYLNDPDFRHMMFTHVPAAEIDNVISFLRTVDGNGLLPRNSKIAQSAPQYAEGDAYFDIYLLKTEPDGSPAIDQSYVQYASYDYSSHYHYEFILLEFNEEGSMLWARITENNIGLPLAIVMDGNVISAPTVQSRIDGGKASIAGITDTESILAWTAILNSGPLKLPVTAERIR